MDKLGSLKHLFVTVFLSIFSAFIVIPAITDVTMAALCPGQDQCSFAIYLTGLQQVLIGLGTVVASPLIGNLSDEYGRKAMLTIPMTLSIIPLAIMAYSRETNYFYAYFVLKTITSMLSEGTVNCLALAYVADSISERGRASAFGVLSGVGSAAFVCGTLAARFLSAAQSFWAAAFVSIVAAVYMRIFLKDTILSDDDRIDLRKPILKTVPDIRAQDGELSAKKRQFFKKIPSLHDLICLLKTSKTFSQAATVVFFTSLADSAVQSSLLYFFKARFHFNKNQYADLMLIPGIAGTISQLLLMPILAPALGEENLLSIGLLAACTHLFLYSISWAAWVPYASSAFYILIVFAFPSIRSIASKQVGPDEQGMAQGCISGISSFASIISPFIFSPLTAMFLSEKPPFQFPGFSIMCIGFVSMIAFIQSTLIRNVPLIKTDQNCNNTLV